MYDHTSPLPYASQPVQESPASQIMQRLFNEFPPFEVVRVVRECQSILLAELENNLNESKESTAQKAKFFEEALLTFGVKR
jgi:hypothetical protein